MSKPGTPFLKEQDDIPDQLLSQRLSGMMWTEPINATTLSGQIDFPGGYGTIDFEISQLLNIHARAMIASFYKIIQRFSQASVTPVHLAHSSSFVQHKFPKQELRIEMPPDSVRDVVINIQRMGRGKPIDFFEETLEE